MSFASPSRRHHLEASRPTPHQAIRTRSANSFPIASRASRSHRPLSDRSWAAQSRADKRARLPKRPPTLCRRPGCGRRFIPRAAGSQQTFCTKRCRIAFHVEARQVGYRMVNAPGFRPARLALARRTRLSSFWRSGVDVATGRRVPISIMSPSQFAGPLASGTGRDQDRPGQSDVARTMTTPFVGVQEDEPAGDHPGEDLDPIASLAYQGDPSR